jgi:hypothetical protein
MSSFDADGYAVLPKHYDVNKRRGLVHRDKHEGLYWRMRVDCKVVYETAPRARSSCRRATSASTTPGRSGPAT